MAINSYNNSSNGAALGNILKIVGTLGDLGIIKTPQAKQAEAQTQLAQQEAANKQTTFDQGQDQVTKFQDPTSKESELARQEKTIFLQSASKLSKEPEYQNAIKSLIDQTNGVKDESGSYVVPPASAYQVKAADESPLSKLINAQVVAKMNGENSVLKAQMAIDKKTNDLAKRLPADKVLSVNEGKNAIKMLEDLSGTLEANKDKFGPFAGRISSMNPYDETGNALNSQFKTAGQTIGKFLEGGVLRKEDEEKYAKMLPQLSNTHESAQDKLQLISRNLKNKLANDIQALKDSGYDVNGLVGGISAANELPNSLTGKNKKQPQSSIPTAQAAQPQRMSEEDFINKFLDAKAKRKQ